MVDLSVKVGRYEISAHTLEELESITLNGFERLQNVFLTKEVKDLHPVSETYDVLEQRLDTITRHARYVHWDRKIQEALYFDKYILQLVIGHESVRQLQYRLPHESLFRKHMSVSQEMMAAPQHDFEVRPLQYKDVSYSGVHDQIYALIKNEKYDYIVTAMREIREG